MTATLNGTSAYKQIAHIMWREKMPAMMAK
jgi:hypothetical protein